MRQRALRGDVVVLLPVALRGAANTLLHKAKSATVTVGASESFSESEPKDLIQSLFRGWANVLTGGATMGSAM